MTSLNLIQVTSLSKTRQNPSISLIQGLSKCSSMSQLKQFHSQIIKLGFSSNNDAMGRLIKFCSLSKKGNFAYALKLFDEIPNPDAFIYNVIIEAFLQRRLIESCFLFYTQMLNDSVLPNNFTLPLLVRACCVSGDVNEGNQVHAHVVKFGFGDHTVCLNCLVHMYTEFQLLGEARLLFDKMGIKDSVSWTSLISGYFNWGFVDEAFEIFESMSERSLASWNAMIAGCVQRKLFSEAIGLFARMREENEGFDKYVAASALAACTQLGALETGKWIHKYIDRNGIEVDTKLATAIIDMYCKCGCLEEGLGVFRRLGRKGISTWNCMIGGLGMHGKGKDAIELFKEMERNLIVPDGITFVNLLSACSHSGLVEEGRHYFRYMIDVHGIEPSTEHFGCMVDLLGRAGKLEEARKVVDNMTITPDESVLGALLGAYKNNRNIELVGDLGKRLLDMEPNNSGRYVLLANLYADAANWRDVAAIRELMDDREVKKIVGLSLIELDGVVHSFVAGDTDHPKAKEMYNTLHKLLTHIKSSDYVLDSKSNNSNHRKGTQF